MRPLSVILPVLAMLTVCLPSEAHMEVVTDSGAKPEFASSVNCAKCHLDIYRYWKDSLHAHAYEDNIFQAAFMLALRERGDKVRPVCLSCHAPVAAFTNDTMMELPISAEAVTCDFCHRIAEIELGEKTAKVTLTAGDGKFGPLEPGNAVDSHPSVRSTDFTDSRFCATCHQWSNERGVVIFDTYREWLNGPYAKKGIHCQNCHMPLVEGSLVTGRADAMGGRINSHNLSGGHSVVQVASAARVNISSVSRVAGGLQAIIEVSNVASGHMIPTGIPSRELVLEVQLLDAGGTVLETDEYIFKKVILDEQHNKLTGDAEIILDGALIFKDNRIPPGETVTVPFSFAASPRKTYTVKATLRYGYRPLVLRQEEISIEMGSDARSP